MDLIEKKVLDNLNIGILLIDNNFEIQYTNKKAKEIFKKNFGVRETCYSLIFDSDQPCANCLKKYLSKEKPKIVSNLSILGNLYIVEYNYLNKNEFLILFKEIEDHEYYKKSFFELLDKLPVLIIFLKKGKIKNVNKATEELLNYKKDELLGKNFIDLLAYSEDKIKFEKWFRDILIKENETCNFLILTKENKTKSILGRAFLLEDIDKEKIFVITGIDVSDIIELKKKAEELYKNQTFSDFLKSLIHDFNNILQITNKYIKNIENNLENPEEIKKYVLLAEKTLDSWIDLNKLLLDYTKEVKETISSKIEVISFLKNNLELFQIIAGPKINIQLDFDYLISVWISGDESFWRYIFLNFINNAKDAMEGEGEIEIKLRSQVESDKTQYLVIYIRDTGCGIPEENLDKIFQPYFTTKEKNSGLGLFLIKNHIENIGGKIEVESQIGKGTVFKVYIPILKIKKIGNKRIRKPEEISIILIEDEEAIRNSLEEFLKLEGYKVYSFSNFKEFKDKMEKIKKVDLLISDFHLPDIEGPSFYRFLKEKFPDLKVIFLTGDILTLAELPSYRMLLKPFKLEEILLKIKEVLQ